MNRGARHAIQDRIDALYNVPIENRRAPDLLNYERTYRGFLKKKVSRARRQLFPEAVPQVVPEASIDSPDQLSDSSDLPDPNALMPRRTFVPVDFLAEAGLAPPTHSAAASATATSASTSAAATTTAVGVTTSPSIPDAAAFGILPPTGQTPTGQTPAADPAAPAGSSLVILEIMGTEGDRGGVDLFKEAPARRHGDQLP